MYNCLYYLVTRIVTTTPNGILQHVDQIDTRDRFIFSLESSYNVQ